jgi:hypothetical protein
MTMVTVDQVMEWHPNGFDRDRMLAVTRGRESLDVRAVSLLPLPPEDLLWVLLRPAVIEEKALRKLCADFAAHVVTSFEAKQPEDKRPRQAIDAARAFAADAIGAEQLKDARMAGREAADSVKGRANQAAMACVLAAAEEMLAGTAEGCARAASEAVPDERDERSWQLAMVREALGAEEPPDLLDGPISVRLARNEDGGSIGSLVTRNGFYFDDFDIDWTEIYPHWVVAEINGIIVGALQVCPGKPLGRLELFCTEPRLRPRHRVKVLRGLSSAGEAALLAQGSQIASGVIPFTMKSYRNIAEKHGWAKLATGNLMAKRLR